MFMRYGWLVLVGVVMGQGMFAGGDRLLSEIDTKEYKCGENLFKANILEKDVEENENKVFKNCSEFSKIKNYEEAIRYGENLHKKSKSEVDKIKINNVIKEIKDKKLYQEHWYYNKFKENIPNIIYTSFVVGCLTHGWGPQFSKIAKSVFGKNNE